MFFLGFFEVVSLMGYDEIHEIVMRLCVCCVCVVFCRVGAGSDEGEGGEGPTGGFVELEWRRWSC